MSIKHPSKEQCMQYLKDYNTPAHVIGHCRAVSETAFKIARELNKHGYDFDLELVTAAGLTHDIARVEDEHWNRGAEFMAGEGWLLEAEIIRVHMHYPFPETIENLTETDMICLADRTVLEDTYVGLDKRMDYIIEKAKKAGRANAEEIINEKKEFTRKFIQQIEGVIGMTFDQLMKGE